MGPAPYAASRQRCVGEIVSAVTRGASLTGHLLAFGCVQNLNAEAIDLRDFFDGVSVLVECLISSDFDVSLELPQVGLSVRVNRNQLENAFVIFALNAKDSFRYRGWLKKLAVPVSQAAIEGGANWDLDFYNLVCICFQDSRRVAFLKKI